MPFMKKNIVFHLILSFFIFALTNHAKAEELDYSLYTSLLMNYNKAYGTADFEDYNVGKENPYSKSFGVVYNRLIDFNDDDIPELVIVRVDKDTMDYTNAMQIYGFDIEGKLTRLAEFTPFLRTYEEEIYNVAFTDYYGDVYLVTGNEGTNSDQTLWRLTYSGFVREIDFKKELLYGNTSFFVNGNEVSEEEFNKKSYEYLEHKIFEQISNVSGEKFMKLMERNMASLGSYNLPAPKNGTNKVATFNDARFVIYEDVPTSENEVLIKAYFDAEINYDLDVLTKLHYKNQFIPEYEQKRFENKAYIPGFIVEDIFTLTDPASYYSLNLHNRIAGEPIVMDFYENQPVLPENIMDYQIIQCTVTEAMDFSHTGYTPQTGYGRYKYWFFLVQEAESKEWKIYSIITDHLFDMAGADEAFKTKFIGYKQVGDVELFSRAYPYLKSYDEVKLARLNLEGDETYLISPAWATAQMRVFEFPKRGSTSGGASLIYQTEQGESLLISLNYDESDPRHVIQIIDPRSKETYNYVPSLISTGNIIPSEDLTLGYEKEIIASLYPYAEEFTESFVWEHPLPTQIVACGKNEGLDYGDGMYIVLENTGAFYFDKFDDQDMINSKKDTRICIEYKPISESAPGIGEEREINKYENIYKPSTSLN